jgi:hypothetical protein
MAKRTSGMTLSTAAIEEFQSLSASDAERVVTFLEHLAENPYDQALIQSASVKGDLFASGVTDKLYVYWSFDPKNPRASLEMQPKVKVLGLGRKRGNHGIVPLLSTIGEKAR